MPKTHAEGEAIRYMENARELLKAISIEDNLYLEKPVREAFGTAYLAILEAINEALIKRGVTAKQLPKSVDGYRAALQEHLAVNNGKLLREFGSLYDSLHIAGYYRGLLDSANVVKEEMRRADRFIKKLLH
ncbi:MAG: DUF5618 family protein [Nitrospirae bacterium]|nr:DUF5618 family protein [Nitrospirota bacterium]